jgi:hypothetical protein
VEIDGLSTFGHSVKRPLTSNEEEKKSVNAQIFSHTRFREIDEVKLFNEVCCEHAHHHQKTAEDGASTNPFGSSTMKLK